MTSFSFGCFVHMIAAECAGYLVGMAIALAAIYAVKKVVYAARFVWEISQLARACGQLAKAVGEAQDAEREAGLLNEQ